MIEYALLIMLGFCVCGLIALLLAPTLWHRAVRLTTKRLEATLPMSLSEIEADKDLLKASYAIKIRRLEAGLSKGQKKSANQLVEISKLQMQIGEFQDRIAELEMQLEERRNAANVFESTIRKRFPELENAVAVTKAALDERAFEINDLTNKMRRRDEALGLAQRAANLQQQEIRALRETLERSGSDTTGRFRRRASQWTLEEYRSEYDRLNVELSKMREQLVLGHEREANQVAVLKTELQQLGEQIMNSVAAQDRQMPGARAPEADAKPWPSLRPAQAAVGAPKRGLPGRPGAKAQPWPGEKPPPKAAAHSIPVSGEADRSAAPEPVARHAPSRDMTQPAVRRRAAASPQAPIVPRSRDQQADAAKQHEAPLVKQETREALQTLLDRGARVAGKDHAATLPGVAETSAPAAATAAAPGAVSSEERSIGDTPASPGAADAPPAMPEPKLDQMFREIFENRTAPANAPAAGPSASPASAEAAEERSAPRPDEDATGANGDADTKRTLLDRLRVMHDRQTGRVG
jgi:hypothetical protein